MDGRRENVTVISNITEEEMKEKSVKKYKYYISVGVRASGVQLVKLTEEEKSLYQNWNDAKANKDFALADEIRAKLIEKGIL